MYSTSGFADTFARLVQAVGDVVDEKLVMPPLRVLVREMRLQQTDEERIRIFAYLVAQVTFVEDRAEGSFVGAPGFVLQRLGAEPLVFLTLLVTMDASSPNLTASRNM